MIKLVTVIMVIVFCSSCAVVPAKKLHSSRDTKCGIKTHAYSLKMVELGNLSATCNTPECIVSIGMVAAVTTGVTAVISGSIVMVGNMLHWIEQQGSCDKDTLEQKVEQINQPLLNRGGQLIKTRDDLEQKFYEIKDEL